VAAVRRLAVPALVVGVLAGCGSPTPRAVNLTEILSVDLPDFVHGAGRGVPNTLCDAEPSGTGTTPPFLSPELRSSATVFYEQAQSTLEAYAWPTTPDVARQFVEEAASAVDGCEYELFSDADTDGDGELDTGTSDLQTVEDWSGSGWTGVRVHRVVSGSEQVDRRLVYADTPDETATVLLVVLRADTDDESVTAVVDDYLDAVAADLA
jgi:hypothetical protein